MRPAELQLFHVDRQTDVRKHVTAWRFLSSRIWRYKDMYVIISIWEKLVSSIFFAVQDTHFPEDGGSELLQPCRLVAYISANVSEGLLSPSSVYSWTTLNMQAERPF
jgi:ATP/ADP translocase